jgi:hypothetical protein
MFKMNKEALTIAGAIFGGFALAVAIAISVSLVGERLFPDHLWPRFLIAVPIVLALCYLLFRRRGNGQMGGS